MRGGSHSHHSPAPPVIRNRFIERRPAAAGIETITSPGPPPPAGRRHLSRATTARACGSARARQPRTYRQPAIQAFLHGYHLAVGIGAGILLAAALIAVTGFKQTRQA